MWVCRRQLPFPFHNCQLTSVRVSWSGQGHTDNANINGLRQRQMKNMMTALLVSQVCLTTMAYDYPQGSCLGTSPLFPSDFYEVAMNKLAWWSFCQFDCVRCSLQLATWFQFPDVCIRPSFEKSLCCREHPWSYRVTSMATLGMATTMPTAMTTGWPNSRFALWHDFEYSNVHTLFAFLNPDFFELTRDVLTLKAWFRVFWLPWHKVPITTYATNAHINLTREHLTLVEVVWPQWDRLERKRDHLFRFVSGMLHVQYMDLRRFST